MRCGMDAGKLSAFLDGELPEEEGAEVAAHLEGCEACRRELEVLSSLDLLPSPVSAPPVAEAEWKRCWAAIEAAVMTERELALRTAEASARLVRRLIPLMAAALVLVAVYGYSLVTPHRAHAVPEPPPSMVFMAGPLGGP